MLRYKGCNFKVEFLRLDPEKDSVFTRSFLRYITIKYNTIKAYVIEVEHEVIQ